MGARDVQISLSASADLTVSAVLVSKATDGGDTWSEPTTLARNVSGFPEGPGFNDKESITADPTNANNVYAVWDRSRFPSDKADLTAQAHAGASVRGDIIFSRTTDGGQTWEAPRDILGLNQDEFTIGNQIAVLPNGTLVDIFEDLNGSGLQPAPNQFHQSVIRSTDHGATRSKVIDISTDGSIAVRDPDTGAFRNNTPDPSTLPTDAFAVFSDDGGQTFGGELRLTPNSFDLDLVPNAGGRFLRDYVGLAHARSTFIPFYTQTVLSSNPTDIFAAFVP